MRWRTAVVIAATVGLVALGSAVTIAAAVAAPVFKVPFPCRQVWSGETRSDHAPANAIDFNRSDDAGNPVVASAPGIVVEVADLGSSGYGRYLTVDHGGGWSTRYAHLSEIRVTVGQRVGYGKVIGWVGSSGASTGPHLHYEQRSDGRDVRIRFNGSLATYWGIHAYPSDNNCTPGSAVATVDTGGTPLTLRSGPGTGYGTAGRVPDRSVVTVSCQTTGVPVRGNAGTTVVWDRIGPGRYVSDAFLETGHGGFVPGVPRCR